MKLGQKAMEVLRSEITGVLQEGDDLVVVGDIALAGTALIVKKEREFLTKYFSEGFLWDAERGTSLYGADRIAIEDADCFYELGVGGILAGLWKMAEVSNTGLHIDLRRIPVRQESIEICERFDLNPYKLFSQGALLIGVKSGDELVRFCYQKDVPAAVIGKAVKGNDRLLYSGENTRYLERPTQDEITKFSWGQEWKKSGILPGKKEETDKC